MKKYTVGPLFALALALAGATALFLTISYAYAMECPHDRADSYSLRIESVTIDGIEQQDLSAYYQPALVAVTLSADITRSRSEGDQGTINADYASLRFYNRVAGPGSYDEIFLIDTSDR
jgi:hypothetical protein